MRRASTTSDATWSASALDYLSLGLNGKLNLNNLFAGYNGKPRFFEVETVVGLNWGHEFFPSSQRWDDSYLTSRFGASFNFNLGESKAWSINVKPAIVYKMDGYKAQCLNKNNAYVEMLAGVTYHSVLTSPHPAEGMKSCSAVPAISLTAGNVFAAEPSELLGAG